MKFLLSSCKFAIFALIVAAVVAGGNAWAQPIYPTASGCKESAILTDEQFLNPATGAFTIDRTLLPGEQTKEVLGGWVLVEGHVVDPANGAPGTPNCPTGGGGPFATPGDGNPTHVIKLSAKPIAGSWRDAGVTKLTWWYDSDIDGFITMGKDTQLNTTLDPSCLDSADGCLLTFGNQPIFTLFDPGPGGGPFLIPNCEVFDDAAAAGADGIVTAQQQRRGGPGCAGIIIVADIENPKPGATLQIRLEAFASDLVNSITAPGPGGTPFSSDFALQYKKAASNIRLLIQGSITGVPGILSPGVNNGSGTSETGTAAISTTGIRTRDDRGGLAGSQSRVAMAGDREYFIGIGSICEAAEPVAVFAVILPPIASGPPTIAGLLGALPCIPLAAADGLNTHIVQIRVGISGPGAQWVQAVHVYADTASTPSPTTGWLFAGSALSLPGVLFEAGEQILSQIPINGVARVGSLEQVLSTSGGMLLVIADAGGVPALLYFTADIDDRAQSSEVLIQVAVDVADIVGFRTSRLLRTEPFEFMFNIAGPPAPPSTGGPQQFDTDGSCFISDPEFFGGIDQWISLTVSDALFFALVDVWVSQTNVCNAASASTASVAKLRLDDVAVVANSVTDTAIFNVKGRGIASSEVEVFALDGKRVFDQSVNGAYLTWNLTADDGSAVANGTYLYVVTVKGADGQVLRSEVRKLVVMR